MLWASVDDVKLKLGVALKLNPVDSVAGFLFGVPSFVIAPKTNKPLPLFMLLAVEFGIEKFILGLFSLVVVDGKNEKDGAVEFVVEVVFDSPNLKTPGWLAVVLLPKEDAVDG